jgi:hypothetical protein
MFYFMERGADIDGTHEPSYSQLNRAARVSNQIVCLIVEEERGVAVLNSEYDITALQVGRRWTSSEHPLYGQRSAVVTASFQSNTPWSGQAISEERETKVEHLFGAAKSLKSKLDREIE